MLVCVSTTLRIYPTQLSKMLAAICKLESMPAKSKIRAHRISLEYRNILALRKIYTISIDSLMYWCIDRFINGSRTQKHNQELGGSPLEMSQTKIYKYNQHY